MQVRSAAWTTTNICLQDFIQCSMLYIVPVYRYLFVHMSSWPFQVVSRTKCHKTCENIPEIRNILVYISKEHRLLHHHFVS